jgi:subtilisin family serine protease
MQLNRNLSLRGRLLITLALVAGLALWLLPGLTTTQAGAGRAGSAAPPARGALSSNSDELRTKAAQQGRLRVIVTLNVPYQAEPRLAPSAVARQRATIQTSSQRVLARLAGTSYQVNATYQIYPFVGLSVDSAALAALLGSPDVLRVTESLPKRPSDLQSNMIIGADLAKLAGYTGTGYAVAVLDSGVQTSHPFFAGRTVAEACFSRTQAADGSQTLCPLGGSTSANGTPGQVGAGAGANCDLALDGCEHGTHVAGIAVGKNHGGGPGYDGVAPEAKLIAIQIFSRFTRSSDCSPYPTPCLSAYDEDLLAALQYVQTTFATSHTIASVNLSLGDGTNNTTPCDTSPYFTAVGALRAINIATVVAAGNQGYSNGLSGPGCVSNAISIGSTTDSDDISSFSNRAGYMSLFAPGTGIESSMPNSVYGTLSGTSMAAPHVAGAWAVMRQRYPSEDVTQILNRLQTTGKPISIGAANISRIQLNTALGLTTTPSATPTATQLPTSTPNPDVSYMLQDGGFEQGTTTTHWAQGSTNFASPICSTSCGGDGPRTGSYWAWFGGTLNAEQGFLEQQKKIAPGPKQLTFWLWWAAGNVSTSVFTVKIDDDEVFALTGATNSAYRSGWTAVAIDISAYADGNVHTLRFEQSNQAGPPYTNIYLDDVNFGNLSGTPMATGTPTASPTATSTAGPGFDIMLPLVR